MTKKQLEDRVAELERRVHELETAPKEQHYHYYPPVYQPPVQPLAPTLPNYPNKIYIGDAPPWGTTTCGLIPNTAGTAVWNAGYKE